MSGMNSRRLMVVSENVDWFLWMLKQIVMGATTEIDHRDEI
jgi:hypothetical protein